MRHATPDELAAFVPARVPPAAAAAFMAAVRANVVLPADAGRYADMIYGELGELPAELRPTVVGAGRAAYVAALEALEAGADWGGLTAAVRAATGLSGRALFKPLRAALTQALDGPELGPVLLLMPRPIARARLGVALAACEVAA